MNSPPHQNHVVEEKSTQNVATSLSEPDTTMSMADFDLIAQVGEGTYGRVYKACHKKSGRLCALKVVFTIEEEDGLSFTAIREIKYLQQLAKKPNVISLLGTFFTAAGELVLVFEYMENDLSGLLSLKDVEFSPAQIKCLMKQILEGLHQCHASGIMHRDIKAANLLVTHGVLKLADFGLATNYTLRPVFSTNVVTLWYRAPELLLGVTRYKAKVDIWSAGCIFIELLTRQSPFPGNNEKHQMELICKMCGTPTDENWPGVSKLEGYKLLQGMPHYRNRIREIFSNKIDPYALDLICKMLALDPESRLTASQALDHDYFWTNPMPCQPSELPVYPPMHEYEAKKTRQTEQKALKRQKGASYRPPVEPPSGFPGVRRPQIKVPGYPPAPVNKQQRPQPLRNGTIGSLPGGEIVDRSAGQQYPPSVHPQGFRPAAFGGYREGRGERSEVGEYPRVGGGGGRTGVDRMALGREMENKGNVGNQLHINGTQRPNGIYAQHHPLSSNGGGSNTERRWSGGNRGSEEGVTGKRESLNGKEKEEGEVEMGEVEEGEIVVYNRPPSDHSLDSQPQPPTGLRSPPDERSLSSSSIISASSSSSSTSIALATASVPFAIVNTNRVMVSTGKRKRGEV